MKKKDMKEVVKDILGKQGGDLRIHIKWSQSPGMLCGTVYKLTGRMIWLNIDERHKMYLPLSEIMGISPCVCDMVNAEMMSDISQQHISGNNTTIN